MNARKEHMVSLIRSFAVMCTHREALDAVRAFERDHAHELAEKIRAAGPQYDPDHHDGIALGKNLAADLIDPEVNR